LPHNPWCGFVFYVSHLFFFTGGLLAFFLMGATIFFVAMDAMTSISFFASFLFGSSSFFGFSSVTRRRGGTYLTLIMLHTSRRGRNLNSLVVPLMSNFISPLPTSMFALDVLRKGLQSMGGALLPSPISRITKSTGTKCSPIFTGTSSAIPKG